jgi:hypothetical protein
MAVTVTANLTLASDADTETSQGTWSGNSGAADTEVKIQGDGSYSWQASKNGRTECTFTPTANLDMSGTGVHFYWWAQNSVAAFMEPKVEVADDPGYTLRLADGSGNYKEWRIAGSDTWGGEWRCFVLDVNDTTDVYASSGTLQLNDIDVITWYVDISNSGQIRIIDNQWNDVCRFGTGLTATGTDFDLTDIADDDDLPINKYGILEIKDGVLFCQGQLQVGDAATTATFTSTDELLVFKDRNANGSGMVASGFYQLLFTGSGLTADVDGLVAKGAGTTDVTRFIFDAGDTDITSDIAGSTFIRASAVTFAVGDLISNSVFNNCGQVVPSTSAFTNNTLSNYVGAEGGALLFPTDDTNISDLVFINNDDGVEYGATSDSTLPKFDNFNFDDVSGKYDVNNTSAGGVTISIISTPTGGANSYNPGGDIVTFSADVPLKITVVDRGGTVVLGAQTAIYKVSDDTELMNEDTIAGGIAETTYNYAGEVPVYIRVRKSSTGDTRYKNAFAGGTITGDGLNVRITLQEEGVS